MTEEEFNSLKEGQEVWHKTAWRHYALTVVSWVTRYKQGQPLYSPERVVVVRVGPPSQLPKGYSSHAHGVEKMYFAEDLFVNKRECLEARLELVENEMIEMLWDLDLHMKIRRRAQLDLRKEMEND